LLILAFTITSFADRVETKGKQYFNENASINHYIYAIKNAPDSEIRRYAIRKLGKLNSPKAVEILLWALRLGIGEQESTASRYEEGEWKVRIEAAYALSYYSVENRPIILGLKRAMTEDPNERVQSAAAVSMGIVGGRSGNDLKVLVVNFLKAKVSQTPINKIQLNIALAKAFGYNGHTDGREHLLLMRVRGYSKLVKKYIDLALRRLR
jgi:HEAT repeat protein